MPLLVPVAALALAACGQPKPEVQIASSAGEPGYAAAYPARLAAADAGLDAIAAEARAAIAELPAYPGQLSGSDWTVVRGAYERADTAGRSRAFADGIEEDAAVRAFFEAERDDISRRVGGAVQAAVSKETNGVEVDVGGTVSYSLKEGVAKRLEKRLAAANEARLFLARNEGAIGKKDRGLLEAQVDAVARISFLVHVAYPTQRMQLVRLRAEAEDVADTLDREIQIEGARCAAPDLEKAAKQACDQRLAELQQARAALDQAVGAYARTEEGMQAEHDALVREHEAAFEALLAAIDEKIEQAPPPAK